MQDTAIAQELTQAWQALTGQDCAMLSGRPELVPDDGEFCFWLPVLRSPGMAPAVVMVWLGRQDTQTLAGAMFGLPLQSLSPADLRDAAGELCNIFASVLSRLLRQRSSTELGLPQPLSLPTYRAALALDASACLEFQGQDPHRIHVCLLDPAPLLFPPREA